VSQRFLEYTGMPAGAALGYGWVEALHPEDRERTTALWADSIRTGRPFEIEYRLRGAGEAYRWFKGRAVPMQDDGGRIVRWFGASTDVDDSKRAEEALRAALAEVERLRDRLQAENVYLQEEIKTRHGFEEIVGRSPALQRVLRQIEQVAPTDTTVLITGETGTGKELVARAIHTHSRRRDRPLVSVNCGAISPGLVESELFGHEKGAFTGALTRKVGRFELADGGTIFLDEIGDLPLDLQVKLLRVLQEGEIERVGGTRSLKVDVRVIAATHQDIQRAVAEGRFRADLYYRLNVFPIHTPALRERRDDIPTLAAHFLAQYAARYRKAIDGISADAMRALLAHPWPGNVRELAHTLERAVLMARGSEIAERDLGLHAAAPARAAASPDDMTLEEAEQWFIRKTLARHSGNVNQAAEALGMSRSALYRRLQQMDAALGMRGLGD